MARRLLAAKPLSEPMLAECWMDNWEQISVNFETWFNDSLMKKKNKMSFAKYVHIVFAAACLDLRVSRLWKLAGKRWFDMSSDLLS